MKRWVLAGCLIIAFGAHPLPQTHAQTDQETRSIMRLSRRVDTLVWMNDSTALASVLLGGTSEVLLINLSDRTTVSLAAGRCPSLSPDRNRMAWVIGPAVRGDIWVMDLRSRETRKLTDGLRAGCLAWSPDGRRIAATIPVEEIAIISADTGAMEQVIPGTERTIVGAPAWTPDSQRLAFPAWWGEISTSPLAIRFIVNRIDTYDLRTRRRAELLKVPTEEASASNLAYAPNGSALLFVLRQIYLYRNEGISVLVDGHAAAWHPDGRSLLFARRTATLGDELFVMRMP